MPTPRNSALFRAVNERIRDVSTTWAGASEPIGFLCECGDADCDGVLQTTIPTFEATRSKVDHFLVLRGHESPGGDRVIAQDDGYLIVAKRDASTR
jgi:hypothetical protein